jgi:hypothetical protein
MKEDPDLLQIDIGREGFEEPEIFVDAPVLTNNIAAVPEHDNNLIETANNISATNLREVYKSLFCKNKDIVSTGESTYREITKGGVNKFIESIKLHFPPYLTTPQQRKNFSMIDVGGGLMTTITHIAQEIEGYYCGIETCPNRSLLFASLFKSCCLRMS